MSFAAFGWAQEVPGIPAAVRLLLIALAEGANDCGVCWPACARLRAKANCADPRELRRRLAKLRDAGLLERHNHFRSDGSQTSSTYRVVLPHVEPCASCLDVLAGRSGRETLKAAHPARGKPLPPREGIQFPRGEGSGIPPLKPLEEAPEKDEQTSSRVKPSKVQVPGFAEFYEAYPKHQAKGEAERAWGQMKPPLDEVLAAIRWQRETGCLQERQYTPLPASWLRAKRWLDEKASTNGDAPPPVDPLARFQPGMLDDPENPDLTRMQRERLLAARDVILARRA